MLAAWSYFGLANTDNLSPEDQAEQLKGAMTCAILSPAGNAKFKIMGVLYKDNRTQGISPQYELLDKFYMGHMIKYTDYKDYEKENLEDHQRVRGEDGQTVLQRAIIEHNILILAKIYLNVSFTQIGKCLDIDSRKAESILSDMVNENRINCTLDQMTNTVEFNAQTQSAGVQVMGGEAEKKTGDIKGTQ